MGRRQAVSTESNQAVMDGIDTDLSVAADTYLAAQAVVQRANTELALSEEKFIGQMRLSGKVSVSHGNHTLSLRKGHVTKDSIVIK